jgi:hypothetical protein
MLYPQKQFYWKSTTEGRSAVNRAFPRSHSPYMVSSTGNISSPLAPSPLTTFPALCSVAAEGTGEVSSFRLKYLGMVDELLRKERQGESCLLSSPSHHVRKLLRKEQPHPSFPFRTFTSSHCGILLWKERPGRTFRSGAEAEVLWKERWEGRRCGFPSCHFC